MRLTRETLLKNAQETVSERTHKDFQILAAYLCGSVLEDEYLLGGTTDIDLFFVRLDEPVIKREFKRLTDEVHLDIAHLDQKEFRRARQLRVHPWLGPALKDARVLYDPQHFMDFTIAGVRGQFDRADHIYARANQPTSYARQLLSELQENQAQSSPENLLRYLRAVAHTANAIAVLSGPPLTERRFLLQFPKRAASVGRPGLYPGLIGLLGAYRLEPARLAGWISDWQEAFQAAIKPTIPSAQIPPARLHSLRLPYYRSALESLAASSQPENSLWPLLHTWTLAVNQLEQASIHIQRWNEALTLLELAGPAFTERQEALQSYLYTVEEILVDWANQNGVGE